MPAESEISAVKATVPPAVAKDGDDMLVPASLQSVMAKVDEAQADEPSFSMEELFHIVRTQIYGKPVEEREEFREHMLRTRFRLSVNRAKVAPSPIQGQGVFATRRIEAGELITVYPGDALRFYPETNGELGTERNGVLFGHHVPAAMRSDEAVMRDFREYSYDVDGFYALVGLPELIQDHAYIGHMCNDAATCEMMPPLTEAAVREKYRKESARGSNATLESLLDALVAVVASRPILEGEEVFVSYGAEYWAGLPMMAEVEPHSKRQRT